MGCRTRVMGNAYDPSREVTAGRGNLSFTSINLPRLAIKAHGNLDIFFEDLDRKIDLVIDQLYDRFKLQCQKKVRNFPFLMGQGVWLDSDKLFPDDSVEEVLKHGTLTLGFIGLAECLKCLIGKHHGESAEAQNLGLEIVGYMRSRMDQETKKSAVSSRSTGRNTASSPASPTGNITPTPSIFRYTSPSPLSIRSGWRPPIII